MEIQRARYQPNRRQKRRTSRRILPGIIAFIFAMTIGAYVALALLKPTPIVSAEILAPVMAESQAISNIAWPEKGQAAFGTAADGVLASKGSEQQKPIASITKVITALAVLDKLPLEPGQKGPTFTVTQEDTRYYHNYVAKLGSVMPVNLGQTITEHDALTGMMLPSANNIADSLTRWVFGARADYLEYANNLLQEYGLENTVVSDASGFSPGSKSTPSDLVKLGQIALNHPVLSEIVSMKEASIPGSGLVKNTNFLLHSEKDAIGIKTGNTDEAGSCLLFAYKFGPDHEETFIGVLMNQDNYYGMFSTANRLKNSVMPNFKTFEVMPAGTVVGQYETAWGATTKVVSTEPLKIYGWAGKNYSIEVNIDDTDAPVLKNQVVGSVGVRGNDNSNVSVMTDTALGNPGMIWRLANYW